MPSTMMALTRPCTRSSLSRAGLLAIGLWAMASACSSDRGSGAKPAGAGGGAKGGSGGSGGLAGTGGSGAGGAYRQDAGHDAADRGGTVGSGGAGARDAGNTNADGRAAGSGGTMSDALEAGGFDSGAADRGAGGANADARFDAGAADGKDSAADAATPDGAGLDVPAARAGSVVNGIQWADTSGKPIQAHGGGVIQVDGYYYWFGENRNPDGTFYAVSCYRSADLVHWDFRKHVLTSSSASELKPANIERPKVVYNASTKKYVMWMHWENGRDYGEARAAVASGDTVDGDYKYQGSARPLVGSGVTDHGKPGYMSRDCTLFVDTDGKGYFLSASNENYDLNLYLLAPDYLTIDSLAAVLFKGGHREAPALWKRGDVYFLLTSGATGWDPNQARYATSKSLASGWSSMTDVGDSTTYHSQSTYVLPVQGSAGTAYLYMGDRWAGAWDGPVNDSTYVWQPITFPSATAMSMRWNNTLTVDVAAGTVTGATNTFRFVNHASGKALSIENGSTAGGAKAVQVQYTGAAEQTWSLSYDNAGYFILTNGKSDLALEVYSQSTSDGAALAQWDSNGGSNQKWRIVDKGQGLYQLLGKQSGKVAEVASGSDADGAPVVLRASSGADNQLWEMSPAD